MSATRGIWGPARAAAKSAGAGKNPPAENAATDDVAEDAVSARASTAEAASAAGDFDSDTPRWPDETTEAAFLAEQKTAGGENGGVATSRRASAAAAVVGAKTVADDQPLPSLESLLARLPAETRETLDDLFRAKFTGVRRVSPEVLKP